MKYFVDIKDTGYATISVEVESKEEAEKKAQEAYFNGLVKWRDCDLVFKAQKMKKE